MLLRSGGQRCLRFVHVGLKFLVRHAVANYPPIGASFTRLAQLKRALGRSTMAALTPLLPFSRNDYWELSELRERLRGAPFSESSVVADLGETG